MMKDYGLVVSLLMCACKMVDNGFWYALRGNLLIKKTICFS